MKSLNSVLLAFIVIFAVGGGVLAQQDRNGNRNGQNQRRAEQSGARRPQDRGQSRVELNRTTNRENNQGQRRQDQGNRNQTRVQPNQAPSRASNRGQIGQNDRSQNRTATTRSRTTNRESNRGRIWRNGGTVVDARTQGRERYNRPREGYMPRPRYGNGYMYRRYSRSYRNPLFIILSRIPLIVYQNSLYRNCGYEYRTVINLSGYPAQVLINDWPYPLDNGDYILYPGQSVRIPVPTCAPYDINTSILIDGVWYREDVYMGNSSELIISDEP